MTRLRRTGAFKVWLVGRAEIRRAYYESTALPAVGETITVQRMKRDGAEAPATCMKYDDSHHIGPSGPLRVADASGGGMKRRVDQLLGVEVGRCLARGEVCEGCGVLLEDVASGHDRPELLPDVERYAGASMCCSNGSTRRLAGRGTVGRIDWPPNQSFLTWK